MMKPEIEFLKDDLKKKYPSLAEGEGQAKFVNSGVHGGWAKGGAERLPKLLKDVKPTVCVFCFGTCEVGNDEAEKSYAPALKDIIKQLKAANVAAVVVSPPPLSPSRKDAAAARLPGLVEQARKAAVDEAVLFVDAYAVLNAVIEKSGKKKDLTCDGVHLNADGYRAMADALENAWGFGGKLAKAGAPRPKAAPGTGGSEKKVEEAKPESAEQNKDRASIDAIAPADRKAEGPRR